MNNSYLEILFKDIDFKRFLQLDLIFQSNDIGALIAFLRENNKFVNFSKANLPENKIKICTSLHNLQGLPNLKGKSLEIETSGSLYFALKIDEDRPF